ncbi:hypothetical protein OAU50_08895 [Planctomycetota bacterium]|nr:hypothetical protein [Planctomycetota bacterium]
MASDKSILIRNIVGVVVLVGVLITALIWLGVFEGDQSDDAQVRALIENSQTHLNDHDWSDFFAQCDMTSAEREKWENWVPRQANFLVLDSLNPVGFISVPEGATTYEIEVHYVAHMNLMGRKLQAQQGKSVFHFTKRDGRWWINMDETAKTIPHMKPPS